MNTHPSAQKPIFSYKKYWAKRFGTAPFLPTTRAEMDELGWDSCDIIIVTGDAYIDHPSFGMALVGRLYEAQGYRVGIIAQPDWTSVDAFRELGEPNLFFGVTSGNMDSMINRYTADKKPRSDDAYTPDAAPNKRPDRAVVVYSQRCKEAYPGVDVMIGSIEASLRRIAQYDFWSDKVRPSILINARADILLYGSGERALIEVAERRAKGIRLKDIRDVRGTAFLIQHGKTPDNQEWTEIDSTTVDVPGKVDTLLSPYMEYSPEELAARDEEVKEHAKPVLFMTAKERAEARRQARHQQVVRIPSFEAVAYDPVLYAHASRTLHLESNPGNARALVQMHGERDVWLNPPPIPLTTEEMDYVFGLPYARNPHPSYGDAHIPAWEMIRFSINIMRGCFGGCTFCSITEHEGRIIQSRSHESVIKEIEEIRDKTNDFKGYISDLGGPTANMYRMACKSHDIEKNCRKLSCVWPDICPNLNTDHSSLIELYRKARSVEGVKKISIGSGLRYDLAVESPEYIKELVTHHVGGYLKIAPEHTEAGPLSMMMKPEMKKYDRFKELFEKASKEAGKEQYLIPYFIAAHPGTSDEDMMNLALWLKKNNFRLDQVQTFMPTPMALATTMWHTGRNPLKKLSRSSTKVDIVKEGKRRKLHKAFLRYHHPDNWPMLRNALHDMGRDDLIGYGKKHLIPPTQPADWVPPVKGASKAKGKQGQAAATNSAANPSRQTTKGKFQTARTAWHPTERFQDAGKGGNKAKTGGAGNTASKRSKPKAR